MIALIRMFMQLLFARLLAIGPIAALFDLVGEAGVSQSEVVDYATIFALGLIVGAGRLLEKSEWGAKFMEWYNLVISWGRSRTGPTYGRYERVEG